MGAVSPFFETDGILALMIGTRNFLLLAASVYSSEEELFFRRLFFSGDMER